MTKKSLLLVVAALLIWISSFHSVTAQPFTFKPSPQSENSIHDSALACRTLMWEQHIMNFAQQKGAQMAQVEFRAGEPSRPPGAMMRFFVAKPITPMVRVHQNPRLPTELEATWIVSATQPFYPAQSAGWREKWCKLGTITTAPGKLWRAVSFDNGIFESCQGVMWPAIPQDLRCEYEREGRVPDQVENLARDSPQIPSQLETAIKMMRERLTASSALPNLARPRFNPLDGWVPDGGPRIYIPSDPQDVQTMAQIGVGSLVTMATLGGAAGVFSVMQVIKGGANLRPFISIPQGQQLVYAAMAGAWVLLKPQTGNAAPSGALPQLFQRPPATGTPFGMPGSQFPMGRQPLRPLPGWGEQAPAPSPFGGQRPVTPPPLFRR